MHKYGVSRSYDLVYSTDLFGPVEVKGWPVDRNQAIVFLATNYRGGERILEIGCGNGSTLAALGGIFKELHGMELSQVRSETAQKNLKGYNGKIISASIEESTPYPDGYFDCIVWADVIEHVIDLWAAMDEIARLLKPGGRLITVTPNIAKIKARTRLLIGKFPSTSATNEGFDVRPGEMFDGGHVHYFTYSMLRKLYSKYGLKVLREIGIGKYGHIHNLFRSLLSSEVVTVGEKA